MFLGKNLVNIESEMGKSLDSVEELRKFSKVLLHEAFGKLPIAMETSSTFNRKRTLEDAKSDFQEAEPLRKKGRRSIAVPSMSPASTNRYIQLTSLPHYNNSTQTSHV